MELECLIDCAGTAAWRRMKAEEYPEDGRNIRAAELLDRLAGGVSRLEGSSLHHELEQLREQQAPQIEESLEDPFGEAVSEQLRSVGFSYCPKDAEALLTDIKGRFSE